MIRNRLYYGLKDVLIKITSIDGQVLSRSKTVFELLSVIKSIPKVLYLGPKGL